MKYYIALVFVFALAGCQNVTQPASSGDIAYIWDAAYTDTYISSQEPDRNFSDLDLMVAQNAVGPLGPGMKTTAYVKFLMPNLPAGAKVEEAYFELYHGGKNEDGTTDDISFNLFEIGQSINARTVTWNNGPDGRTATGGIPIGGANRFRSQDWCSSADISGLIQSYIDDTSKNKGFRVTITDPRTYYKGFYGSTSVGRTSSNLGKAPRIVMKILMPAGTANSQNISWPNLPSDYDLRNPSAFPPGQTILISQYQFGGSDFPSSWEVKKGS